MGGTVLDVIQRLLHESSQWGKMRDIINDVEYRLPARGLSQWETETLVAQGIIPSDQPNHPPLQPVEQAAGVSPRPIADAAGMPEAKASPSDFPPLHRPAAKMAAAVSFKQATNKAAAAAAAAPTPVHPGLPQSPCPKLVPGRHQK